MLLWIVKGRFEELETRGEVSFEAAAGASRLVLPSARRRFDI